MTPEDVVDQAATTSPVPWPALIRHTHLAIVKGPLVPVAADRPVRVSVQDSPVCGIPALPAPVRAVLRRAS